MEYYYYFENDQELGPFSMEELRDKRIKKSMLLWKEGMPYWEKAETFDELKHIIFSEPPPIRKVEPISTVDFPSDETELKIPKNNDSDSKFDLTYKREQDAIIIGIAIIIISLFLVVFKPFKMDTIESYNKARAILTIIDLVLRIAIVYWIVNIAKRQNRNHTNWGILGFFFPSISLIIIGLHQKLKYEIKIDPSLTKIEQFKKLNNDAESLNNEFRKTEAKIVYQFILENFKDHFKDYLKYAILLFELKDYSESEFIFSKLKNEIELSDEVNYYLGFINVKKGEFENAITILKSVQGQQGRKSQALLNSLIQTDIDYLNDGLLNTKYDLSKEITKIEGLDIFEGVENLNLTTQKKVKCSLLIYQNGIKFIIIEDSWSRREHFFFASIGFIKTFERIEGSRFIVTFKNDKKISFFLNYENSYLGSVQEFIDQYEKAYNNFFH